MSNGFSNLSQLTHKIPLDKAKEMTTTFRDNKEKILKQEYASKDILPICETFNKQAFSTFMNNANYVGIRIYYGMDAEKKVHSIFVGVNAAGEDVLSRSQAGTTTLVAGTTGNGGSDDTIEEGQRCPPFCPPPPPPP